MTYAFARRAPHPLRACTGLLLVFCASFLMPAICAAAPPAAVDIKKFAFGPHEITVAPGTTIIWTNHDETPHTVTSNDKSFASKGLDTDDKFAFTFTTPGTFEYFCSLHPHMTGTIVVEPAGPGGAAP